jgi:hypothetical protein
MQLSVRIVTATAGALITCGVGLALAGPSLAASSTPAPTAPTPLPSSVLRVGTPTIAPDPSFTMNPVVASAAPVAGIEVPAGNAFAQNSDRHSGPTTLEISALLAGGVALAGAGTIVIVRRRP